MSNFEITAALGDAIHAHALAEYEAGPREACGLVVRVDGANTYWPCRNLLEGRADAFQIDPMDYARAEDAGEVVAIVHSHPNASAHPSDADRLMCNRTGLPWLIISEPSGVILQCHPDPEGLPLLGRTFHHGIVDCYTLVRDYYQQRLGIELPDFDRADGWWEGEGAARLYRDNFSAAGFVEMGHPDNVAPRAHDVLLMMVKADVENHAAVMEDPAQAHILQHLYGRPSARDLWMGYWRRHTTAVLRHQSLLEIEE